MNHLSPADREKLWVIRAKLQTGKITWAEYSNLLRQFYKLP